MYFLDIPVHKRIMPEQDMIDDDSKPVDGLDHIIDSYNINMEVQLSSGEEELYRQVVGLCLDKNGRMIRIPHNNPVINTVLYKIKVDHGTSKAYGANIIAKNMRRTANNEGYHEDSLHLIIDIQFCKNAVKDKFIYSKSSKQELRKTTRGLTCSVQSRVVRIII